MAKIAETSQGEVFVEAAHLNGGKDWFGYIYRSETRPRLSFRVKYTRRDRGTEVQFMVDGIDVGPVTKGFTVKIPCQVEPALAKAPDLSAGEIEALEKVPEGGLKARALWTLIGIDNYLSLARKGQLVGKDGVITRVAT